MYRYINYSLYRLVQRDIKPGKNKNAEKIPHILTSLWAW